MSIVTFSEACNLGSEIEIEGIVKSMSKPIWMWFDDIEDYRRICNAKLTDGKGNMINIAFWGDDISKVRNNLKIQITDAKWDNIKKILYKTKFGKIIILGFNPNLIQDDILNLKKRNKIISFKEYKKHVENSPGPTYLGTDRKKYLVITRAFAQIEKLASKFRNSGVSSAIKYLHNNITLSAEQICTILKIFNISVPCDRILKNSIPSKLKENKMICTQNSYKITVKKNDSDSIHLETTTEDIQGPISTELPNEISVSEASPDDKFTPIMIENIKYCGNYVDGDSKC